MSQNPNTEELLKMCQAGGSMSIDTQGNSTQSLSDTSPSQSGIMYATEGAGKNSLNGILRSQFTLDE